MHQEGEPLGSAEGTNYCHCQGRRPGFLSAKLRKGAAATNGRTRAARALGVGGGALTLSEPAGPGQVPPRKTDVNNPGGASDRPEQRGVYSRGSGPVLCSRSGPGTPRGRLPALQDNVPPARLSGHCKPGSSLCRGWGGSGLCRGWGTAPETEMAGYRPLWIPAPSPTISRKGHTTQRGQCE